MADIFDEIGEELRAERTRKLLARYGWVLVTVAVLIVAGAGAWQWWRDRERSQAEAAAGTFLAASRDLAVPVLAGVSRARQEGMALLDRLTGNAPESYRTLARLRLAAAQAGTDPAAALQTWEIVAADPAADPLLRGLATLLWAQHQLDHGDPAALEARLRPLSDGAGPWRALAQEQLAWLDLRQGKSADAAALLRGLTADPLAPQGVRARAGGLLGQMGEAVPAAGGAAPAVAPAGE